MKIDFRVEMPDELFEEFFRRIRAFEQTHAGVNVMMASEGSFTVDQMEEIMQRVMPGHPVQKVRFDDN